jgi:hypothetical protein
MSEQEVISTQAIEWIYSIPPKTDSKVNLLTIGRTSTTGNWYGKYGEFFIAWHPLAKRNKGLEDQLVAQGVIPR